VPAHPAAPLLTACRADAIAMGVLLALGWRNEKCKALFYRYRTLVFAACLLLLAAYLYLAIWNPSQYTPEMYAWGFSVVDALFACLLAIAIMVPGSMWAAICRFRFLADMGRLSYCLYVTHQVIDLACHKLLLHDLPRFDTWRTALVSTIAAIVGYGLAAISGRFFADPLLRRGHALKY
jgi:peptidoglycan/LPS O-acetylase OafA/YrhL